MRIPGQRRPLCITIGTILSDGRELRAPVLSTGESDGAISLLNGELVRVERWDDDRYTIPAVAIPLTASTALAERSADVYTALSAFAALQDIRELELLSSDRDLDQIFRF